MEVHLIWAQDNRGGIGENGNLPWHISEDLKNFKKITSGSTIVMGRKTWESLPIKPLPNRDNIIMSTKNQYAVTTYNSYEECINELSKKNIKKIFIIGGRSLYELFFNDAHFLHITNVHYINNKINEFFPITSDVIEKKFHKISSKNISEEATYNLWVNKLKVSN